MIDSIRSEFRKLLTVRSTYLIIIASMLITALFAGVIEGYKGNSTALQNPKLLSGESTSAIVFVGLVLAFAGLLLFGHEYNYKTIMYTLTSSNRRFKSLLAKLFVISVFGAITALFIAFFSPLCTILGVHIVGNQIGPQQFNYASIMWRCVFVGWGYAMYAFILIAIIRNQIGALVTFLIVPLIGENILMLLLKDNTKYLPFTALQAVAAPDNLGNHTTSAHSAIVSLAYIAVGLFVSAILFLKRDAN